MNDEDDKPAEKPAKTPPLPPQSSPTDTSNWDDRAFTAPDGRDHIEETMAYPKEDRGIMEPRVKKQQSSKTRA